MVTDPNYVFIVRTLLTDMYLPLLKLGFYAVNQIFYEQLGVLLFLTPNLLYIL